MSGSPGNESGRKVLTSSKCIGVNQEDCLCMCVQRRRDVGCEQCSAVGSAHGCSATEIHLFGACWWAFGGIKSKREQIALTGNNSTGEVN